MNTNNMKAIVCTKYGSPDGLELKEIQKPTPKENEILIKIHATTVTAGDVFVRKLTFPLSVVIPPIARILFGIKNLRKEILGHEFAGEIESVGKNVKTLKKGDAVFGTTTGVKFGAHAQFICLPEDAIVTHKPSNMTYEQAAAAPVGGLTALYLLKKAKVQPGQRVLIYGASGSVGTFAVQIAKSFGAEVTGVSSTKNLALVHSLGADYVMDYTKDDFAKGGEKFDVVFDAVGKISSTDRKNLLKENGAFVSIKNSTNEKTKELLHLKELIEADKVKSIIDRSYSLAQTAEAHRYVETGRKRGNVIINVSLN